jgi:hypothetical protein
MQRVAEALQEQFPGVSPGDSGNAQPTQLATEQTAPIAPKPLPQIQAPISLGELIDKITILQIKTNHLQGKALENVQKELTALQQTGLIQSFMLAFAVVAASPSPAVP